MFHIIMHILSDVVQVQSLTTEYRRQLEEIETAFMLERSELLQAMKTVGHFSLSVNTLKSCRSGSH